MFYVYLCLHHVRKGSALSVHSFLCLNLPDPGGTGDLTLMFEHLVSNFEPDTKFVGVGFSMGAFILVRFLGEQTSKQNKFLCAVSVSQGYSSFE